MRNRRTSSGSSTTMSRWTTHSGTSPPSANDGRFPSRSSARVSTSTCASRCDVHLVRYVQAAPPVPTPDRRLSHRVRRRRPLRSVPRPRGGSRLREGRARPVVRPGRDRVHLVRPFRGRATEPGGPDVRNYLGAFGHVAIDHIVTLRRLPRPNTSIEILGRRRSFGGLAEGTPGGAA